MIKDEVGSVDGFGGDAREQRLVFGLRIRYGRGVRFEVERVEVWMSGFSGEKDYSLAPK